VSNDPALINVFKNGEDLYSRVAIQAFKIQEDVSAIKSDDNYLKKVRPDLRQRAKSIALAIPYGAGAWQIGQTLGIHIKEAQKLVDGYLDGFPELAKWMSDTHLRANTIGRIVNKTGRIRHLDKVRYIYEKFEDNLIKPWVFKGMKEQARKAGNEKELQQLRMEYKNGLNNAKNFQIQSLAASIMNRSAIAIHKAFKEKGLDAYIMLQIHDEFVVNCSEDIADEVSALVKHHMETTVNIETGLVAEPNIADDFGEGHI
jgi:DNA polymerase-1